MRADSPLLFLAKRASLANPAGEWLGQARRLSGDERLRVESLQVPRRDRGYLIEGRALVCGA